MKIRRIYLQREDMLKMAEAERAFILLAGHMQNELNSLNKVFGCCLHNSSPNHISTIENLANGAQALIYARILAGKLCEAREALQKAFFGTGLSQRIEPKLHPVAQDALKKIKSYFNKKDNSIFRVRHDFAFHYTIEKFNSHWEETLDDQNIEFMILGGTVGNNLHVAAELVANAALLNGINSSNKEAALGTFYDDVHSVTSNFTEFLEGAILAIVEEQLGSSYFATHGREEDIFPVQSWNEVTIPFFIKPDIGP